MKTSGLDVHKDTIFCAIYDGKSCPAVKEFSTATVSIRSPEETLRAAVNLPDGRGCAREAQE
jgi:hypothetical protein